MGLDTELDVLDLDGDGRVDAALVMSDLDGDGRIDVVAEAYDLNHDGQADLAVAAADGNGDGVADVAVAEMDINGDGIVNQVAYVAEQSPGSDPIPPTGASHESSDYLASQGDRTQAIWGDLA